MSMSVHKKTEGMRGQSEASCLFLSLFSLLVKSKFSQSGRGESPLKCNLMPKIMLYCCVCINIVNLNMSFPTCSRPINLCSYDQVSLFFMQYHTIFMKLKSGSFRKRNAWDNAEGS